MTTQKRSITRRELTVLAATMAALPAAAAASPGNPADTELLRLNDELERRWKVAWDLYGPAADAATAADEELERRASELWPDRAGQYGPARP